MDDAGRAERLTWLAFVGLVLFGGANAVAVRQSVLELDPVWAAGLRFAVAGALMAAIALASRQPLPSRDGIRGGVLYGTFAFAISFACINIGLRDVPGGTGSVIVASAPLLTLGLAIAQGQERFHVRALVGAIIAVLGVAVVFIDQLETAVPLGSLILVLLGATSISQSSIVIRGLARNDPLWTNAIGMLTGSGLLLALSAILGEAWLLPTRSTTWIAMGYLVVFGSVVAFSLSVYALRRLPASVVAYAVLLFPLVGVTVATLLTGERFSPSFVAGGVVMLVGVYIGAFRRTAKPALA
jgi:drug/metabolite transporter (DMT)-like permease